jgi:hypothetical protein
MSSQQYSQNDPDSSIVNIGHFDYILDRKAGWVWKANLPAPINPRLGKQKIGREVPQYKLIDEIEKSFIDAFKQQISDFIIESTKLLLKGV